MINPVIIVDKCSHKGSDANDIILSDTENSGDLDLEEFKNNPTEKDKFSRNPRKKFKAIPIRAHDLGIVDKTIDLALVNLNSKER